MNLIKILALFLVLGGCASIPNSFSSLEDKTFIHKNSDTRFPIQIGEFKRVEPREYLPDGSNISVGYNLRTSNYITATIYIYAQEQQGNKTDLDSELTAVLGAIQYYNPDYEIIEEMKISKEINGELVTGKFLSIEYTGQGNSKRETLTYLYDYKGWFVKYRITYPMTSSNSRNIIEDFLSMLDWPKIQHNRI